MKMRAISTGLSCWVLYKGFFNAVPGQRGLIAIGLLLMALGYMQSGTHHAELFTMAGTAFVAGFTLLFAGPHFRQLASFRRHALIPHFRKHLIISYLLALISLSLFTLIGITLLDNQNPTLLPSLGNIPTGLLSLSLSATVIIISLFGFLPGYLRYPAWLLLIVGTINISTLGEVPLRLFLYTVIGVSITSLFCFMYFMLNINNPNFYNKKAISLTKYLPGLNGSFQERGVTAIGSILLGISDGNSSRFIRALFTVFLLPVALACTALLTEKYSAEQLFQNPLFILMGLIMGALLQIHFAFSVGTRKRFIWLRAGGNRQQINTVAQKVLARERWVMALCFGLWCIPAVVIFPSTAVWLLGVAMLLWIMILLLEHIILTLKHQLSQRAEFYMLLMFIGIVIGFIASAHVHQQPTILWWGVATLFLFYAGSLLYRWWGSIGLKERY